MNPALQADRETPRSATTGRSRLRFRVRPVAAVGRLIGWGEPGLALPAADDRALDPLPPAMLAANAGLALLVAAVAANGSRMGMVWAVPVFYGAVAWIFLPFAARLLHPATPRAELVADLGLLMAALFVARVIREPMAFIDHDEFLHWSTAQSIIETGALFSPNPLLPVSPLYPGLELVTTAIIHLSGLTVFDASLALLAVARITFILTLFFTYERIGGSARIAACGCLVYAGSSTFFVFDSQFSYESLAVTFVGALLLAEARSVREGRTRHIWLIFAPIAAALGATHHMSAFFAAILFTTLAALEYLRTGAGRARGSALLVAALAVLLPVVWSNLMGNPSSGYLGPVIAGGLKEAIGLFGHAPGRKLFTSEDGSVAPLWERLVAVGSVALVALGLLTGFLRAIARSGLPVAWRTLSSLRRIRNWSNSRLLLLTLLTLAFPLSILFRLTRSGWEIGNRVGPFSFFGVGLVIAIAVGAYWQGCSRRAGPVAAIAVAGCVILVGGIISAQGPRILVPAQFEVSADAASIEPMSISAARWAKAWLGPGNLFASDRINRLLLSTYGRQGVATTLQEGLDTGEIIMARTLGWREISLLRETGVEFVTVDLRLTTALPTVGVYFDGGAADQGHIRPPRAEALLKFNLVPQIGRIFDDGYLVTYDVRGLRGTR